MSGSLSSCSCFIFMICFSEQFTKGYFCFLKKSTCKFLCFFFSVSHSLSLVSVLGCFSHQVAIIAGNFELAELIKNHKESDIGE